MESAESNLLTITDNALAKLHELNKDNKTLRIAVIGGGCSGLQYKMEWIDKPEPNDKVISFVNLSVAVDPKSALFMKGLELCFSDGLDGSGFEFENPNASRSCGCGSSFSV